MGGIRNIKKNINMDTKDKTSSFGCPGSNTNYNIDLI
jgi:hypothetical protein